MRASVIASSICLAAVMALAFAAAPGFAQQIPNLKPPPAPPIKPYKALTITPPVSIADPTYVAFRKDLVDIANKKDHAALAKLVVAKGFFWIQDKDLADKNKSGMDNLVKAIDLDAKDGSGWATVGGYAADPTASEFPDRKGVICAPGEPGLDVKELQALGDATQTDPTDWAYPSEDGVEVRAAGDPKAPVIEKLGMILVHVLPDTSPTADANAPSFLRIATPSGKAGFVPAETMLPIGGDKVCYTKDATGWKITGILGGSSQ